MSSFLTKQLKGKLQINFSLWHLYIGELKKELMIDRNGSKIQSYEVTSSLKIPNWLQMALEEYSLWKKDLSKQQESRKNDDQFLSFEEKAKICFEQGNRTKESPHLFYFHLKIFQGKVSIDFRSQQAVVSLTKCILRVVFGIKWNLPVDNLCPRVPNRLNYLMWIHRYVINKVNLVDFRDKMDFQYKSHLENQEDIIGIDIGTGASLIYPLLGSRVFGWKFVATQLDQNSIKYAQKLIDINNLKEQITIAEANKHFILRDTINPLQKFDFLMCNPPFFDTQQDFQKPLSIMTSKQHNTLGGEYEFFFSIYMESFYFPNIRVFTMLIGLGRDFQDIRAFLTKEHQEYGVLEQVKFGKLNQSQNTRFIISWKVNTAKVKETQGKQVKKIKNK